MKDKKTVFITGSGSGLGKEVALCLARRGHNVIATVLYDVQINEILEIAKKDNLPITCFKLDILNEKERNLILNYDIDVLICNAAIGDSGSVSEVFIDRIENVFNTNIFTNLRLVQLALTKMIKLKKHGRIVFISSLAGRIPFAFLSPYCASKAAIEVFVTCLRKEMKKLKYANIEVCAIEPGAYATGFNKENNEKKYTWMEKDSYFINQLDSMKKKEKFIWNILEQKPYTSIIRQYVKAVEDKKAKSRYYAPWWQVLFVQLARILGID